MTGENQEEQKSAPAVAEDKDESELDEGRTSPFGWVSLVVIVTLVVGTWFLITRLMDDGKMQDCVQSGRRNCAPIEDTGK